MKKIKIIMYLVILLTTFIMTGCTTSKSYTYKVSTGDNIKVTLNTTNGYDMTSITPFEIKKDNKTLSNATFITTDEYNQYISAVNSDEFAKIIEKDTKNGLTYTFYSYNNQEYNYIIKINNSNTAVILANPNSEDEAKTIFNLLKFKKN